MSQPGRSLITGDWDIPATDGSYSALYGIQTRIVSRDLTSGEISAAGRGDAEAPEIRPGSVGGVLISQGQFRLDSAPYPIPPTGSICGVTLHYDAGKFEQLIVRVISHRAGESEDKKDFPWLTITAVIIGTATLSGYSDQPSAEDEGFDEFKELWAGMRKTFDENGLLTNAAQRFLCWGVGDDDASEAAAIDDVNTFAPQPLENLKRKTTAFTRHPTQHLATYMDIEWSLTDSADDVTLPLRVNVDDDFHIGFEAKTLALNGTPATPGYVDAVKRRSGQDQLNDEIVRNWTEWGTRDLTEDIFLPRIYVRTDDNGLMSDVAVAYTWATTGSPPLDATADALLDLHDFTLPDGMIIQAREDRPIDRVNNLRIWIYGYRISTDAEAAAMFSNNFDTEGIEETGTRGEVFDIGFGPAGSPSTPYDGTHPLVLRGTRRSTTSNPQLDKMLYEYGLYNTRTEKEARSVSAPEVYTTNLGVSTVTEEVLVEDCADTDLVSDLAYSKLSSLIGMSDAALVELVADKSDSPWRVNYRVTRRTDDYAIVEESLGAFQKPSMFDGLTGTLYWLDRVEVADTGTWVQFAEGRVMAVQRRIHLIRLVLTDTVDDFRNRALDGRLNDATFLDFPALTLLYEGCGLRYNWQGEGGTRPVVQINTMLYETYDGAPGHYWSNQVPNKWYFTATAFTPAHEGTQQLAATFNSNFTQQAAGTGDFSGLLS